jgi:hypothetical protein
MILPDDAMCSLWVYRQRVVVHEEVEALKKRQMTIHARLSIAARKELIEVTGKCRNGLEGVQLINARVGCSRSLNGAFCAVLAEVSGWK